MPVAAAVGDVFQVKVRGEIEGQQTNNIFFFLSATGDTDVETHLILVLAACFVTHILPVLSSAFKLVDVAWKKIHPTLDAEYVTVPPGTLVGGAGAALPSFVSIVTSVKSLQGGRSHRGRFYLAGVPEAATNGSALDTGSALWTAYLAFINCIVTNFVVGDPPAANSWQMEIFSRKLGGNTFPVTGTAGFTAMTTLEPHSQLGTTRSRKIGHGH
jgi:hypothetical protein